MLAGLTGSVVLAMMLPNVAAAVALGILVGVVFGLAFRPVPHAYIDCMMTAAALTIPIWGLLDIIVFPILAGQPPRWTAAEMRDLVPHLAGWVLYGAALGLVLQALNDLALAWLGPEPEPPPLPAVTRTRILILGGGFAG